MADKKKGKSNGNGGNGGAPKSAAGGNGGPPAPAGLPEDAQVLEEIEAPVIVQGQYLRDLSFESPNAPESLQMMGNQPDINVEINVKPQKVGDNDYEVVLYMKVTAEEAGKSLFIVECDYAGLFTLSEEIGEEEVDLIVAIEAPRLLFPFTRNIIADAIREGGFPPLLIQPIDFVSLYQQQMEAGGEGFPPIEQS